MMFTSIRFGNNPQMQPDRQPVKRTEEEEAEAPQSNKKQAPSVGLDLPDYNFAGADVLVIRTIEDPEELRREAEKKRQEALRKQQEAERAALERQREYERKEAERREKERRDYERQQEEARARSRRPRGGCGW